MLAGCGKLVAGQLQGKTVVYAAVGGNHTLCITADGSLFGWGENTLRQLGVGDKEKRQVPTLITGLQGKHVVHVAAGMKHAICTTTDDSVLAWGYGGDGDDSDFAGGQLGLCDDCPFELVPTLVSGEMLNKAVVHIAAGDEHSMCVTRDGLVYSWGNIADDQLGVVDMGDAADLPVLVQTLDSGAKPH